jgi:serine/threonine protein kinase/tetratricopeptide (TPR) repeat protein
MTAIEDPLVGRTIAQYQVVARVGGGAMGVVYQARDTKLGRLVALKFLPQQWSHDETAKQRFVREAQAASATNHPNICTIHDIETADDGQLFIVMAFYEGQTLKQRLESGQTAIEEALEIATGIADGLAKAHAQGVVHRDIKPGNVILTEEGPRILDFGLATFVDALKLTAENTSFGTPAYMSPEQVRGQTADARADVWAVGVVLYEMLAGHVPFQGAYAEAVAHAILHESPAPLRGQRPDVPEEIEQLVFRALHKDPNVRFQSGRALARALRQVRGLSVPVELRTEPLAVPQAPVRTRRWSALAVIGAAAVLAAASAAGWVWMRTAPTRLIVAPLINITGVSDLERFRLALTHTLSLELSGTDNVLVVPYVQTLGRIRRFIATNTDVSGPQALQALTSESPSALIVVPSLVYENDLWRGRAEIRSAATGLRVDIIETDAVPSSLPKDIAYELVIELSDRLRRHFSTGRWLTSYASRPPSARFRTLDAASAFEQGIRAFDELEYVTARAMFSQASEVDSGHPMPLVWLARVALLMRRPNEARDAAERSLRLVNEQTPWADGALVAAVVAEARGDMAATTARYEEWVRRAMDRPSAMLELGAFFDRRGQDENAVRVYQDALALDGSLVRAHLELCRLYSPSRLNQTARAEEYGRRAVQEYRRLGDSVLEAQALFCLTDVLRMGNDSRREEGRANADAALKVFESLPGHPYNLARAYNYAALAADAQRRSGDALSLWERSLTTARSAGNVALEPLVLMNLGVTFEAVGNRARAFDYYQQSMKFYEDAGDTQRAAQSRANVGAILIDNGGKPDEGLQYIRNVLPVFRSSNNKDFEVFCQRVIAWYYQNAGHPEQAELELQKAIAIASAAGLSTKLPPLKLDLGRASMERGEYVRAHAQLAEVLGDGSGPDVADARIRLASVEIRLGEFASAASHLRDARQSVELSGRRKHLPAIDLLTGELAYESGARSDARGHFSRAAASWIDTFPDPSSVEARGYLGLLDGLAGDAASADRALRASLEQAKQMKRAAIETRVRVFLARLYVETQRGRDALDVLSELAPPGQVVNPELIAQAHYWRGQAHLLVGDRASAQTERARARTLAESVRARLSETYRTTFAARPDIRLLLK